MLIAETGQFASMGKPPTHTDRQKSPLVIRWRSASSLRRRLRRGFPCALAALAGLIAFFAAAIPHTRAADTVLIDFSTVNNTGETTLGGWWNTFAMPVDIHGGGSYLNWSDLLTRYVDGSDVTPCTIMLDYSGPLVPGTTGGNYVFNNNQAGLSGQPSWAASSSDDMAAGDYFYVWNTPAYVPIVTFTLQGLTPGTLLSIDLLTSLNSSNARGYYSYSADHFATQHGFDMVNPDGSLARSHTLADGTESFFAFRGQIDGWTNHRYLNISDVVVPQSGTVDVRIQPDFGTNDIAPISAMRLSIVPEPGASALIAFGALALASWRAKRRG
jgi:hypothetical protein